MKNLRLFLAVAAMLMLGQANAHFQMIIPADDMVKQTESRNLDLNLMFWHPYEGIGMDMVVPERFGVVNRGKDQDLLATLKPAKKKDIKGNSFSTYQTSYKLKRPGDHVFYVEPKPYWEAAEESFIIHEWFWSGAGLG